jgi:hypothetical protein
MNENIRIDLEQRLARLDVAWAAMNGQQAQPPAGIATMALWWARALAGEEADDLRGHNLGGDGAAYRVLRYLVPAEEAHGSGFWSTDLGRAIASYGYAPVNESGQVPSAVVGAIMGFTRSRAHELQGRGRLTTPGLVAAALREREEVAT